MSIYYGDHVEELISILQSFKKYKNLSFDEIIELFDTIEDLKLEVERMTLLNKEYQIMKTKYDIGFKENIKNTSVLTNNLDVNYQILLNLDVKDLSRYCRTNSYVQNLCNNTQFWLDKFKHDGLNKYIAFGDFGVQPNHLLYHFIHQNFIYPTDVSGWLKVYDNLIQSKKEAEYIFKIYNTEYVNTHASYMTINGDRNLMLLLILWNNKYYFEDIANKTTDEINIMISFVPTKNMYVLQIMEGKQFINSFNVSQNFIILLNRVLYYQKKFGDIYCIDKNGVEYIIDDQYIATLNPRDPFINLVYTRYGMLKLLKNTKKTLIV